jgi:hypothetical protein
MGGKRWANMRKHPGARNGFGAMIASAGAGFSVLIVAALSIFGFRGFMPIPTTVILLVSAGMAWLFRYLLKAPTANGAATFNKIAGFRIFLMAAEKDRLEMLNPPAVTPEIFEKYLPYAIALNCETQWSRNFEAEVGAAQIKSMPYQPG